MAHVKTTINELAVFETIAHREYSLTSYLRGSITVKLVSCLTGLDSKVSVHANNSIFSCLIKSNLVKLEINHTETLVTELFDRGR